MKNASDQVKTSSDALTRAIVELEAMRDEFSGLYYAVSHDLGAPVRSIVGFSKALDEDFGDQLPPAQKDYLARIIRNATKLESMMNGLLSISRIAKASINIEPINLSQLVLNIVDKYKQQAPERPVRTVVENHIVLYTDNKLITKALEQLIDNSWKFSKEGLPLEIFFGIDRTGPANTCYVKDNGVGFDTTFADKLFNPFQRLHPESQFPGSGIGLATVHRIMRHMNGTVWADAEPNQGATFYFCLPPVWGNIRGIA